MQGKRILYITENIGVIPQCGGEIRDAEILKALLELGCVDCLVFGQAPIDPSDVYMGFNDCRSVQYVDLAFSHANGIWRRLRNYNLGRLAQLVFSPFPYYYSGRCPETLVNSIKKSIRKSDYDLIWIQNTRLAFCLRLFDRRKAILDGDDFDSVRFYQLLKNEGWYGAKFISYLDIFKFYLWELLLPSLFRTVIRCSLQDKLRIDRSNVIVVPNGSKIPADASIGSREINRFLFVGLLGYEPNKLGVEWFLSNIWPLIRAELPDARIDVIGKQPSDKMLRYDGVHGVKIHGFVSDIDPFLRRACCSVVPITSGGGTRLKIVESLAFATPVVSTTIGAFGLEIGEKEGLFRADSESDFARNCVEVAMNQESLADQCERGQRFVKDNYDWKVVREQVKSHVRGLWN
jgi:glycosyltransferase involved in cell wall biosynthesis